MNRPSTFAMWMVLAGTGAAGAGCGSDEKPKVILTVESSWNESPATPDDTGYQLSIDVFWPDRAFNCFSLPADLRVTANDKQMPLLIEGKCGGESLVFINGFQQNVPVTIGLEGGSGQTLGEATYDALFPGAASVLVAPTDGQVKPADPIVVQMGLPPIQDFAYPEFFWMEPPAGVPPYHTSGMGTLAPDGSTFQTPAPTTTGRAAMIVRVLSTGQFIAATACTGFESCNGLPDTGTVGPVFIDVVP